jgi:HEAT repeat protein
MVLGREQAAATVGAGGEEERGVTMARAIAMLRDSRQIQIIALIISFGSFGAAILDQQVNMAAEVFKGAGETDSISAFLAQIRFYTSAAAFVIQVWVTPRIHRYLGIGFALLMLPTNLSITAAVILLNNALWAPALARVTDQSFRYTVDKTTREVLFLPLPTELRQEVKPMVDVTVDRLARAAGALMILVLIQPWGLSLHWNQLSVVSLGLAVIWFVMAVRAKREYLTSFRRSIEQRIVQPEQVRLNAADLSTIETLVQELAQPDAERVIYAIDVLESLDKRNLVTPLLLYHESPKVRARALQALAAARSDTARRWAPNIRRLLADPDAAVRAGAIAALGAISNEDAASLARPMLADEDPRIRATAAAALSTSTRPEDLDIAEAALAGVIADTSEAARDARRDVAVAIRQTSLPRFQRLLIPLLYDPAAEVADEAMASVRASGAEDFVFVPTLIALLRHRRLKGHARAVLVGYGESVVDALAHFMRDPEEDIWVRRHIPATLALIPGQKAVDVLTAALAERDGFLRYKAVSALERLRRNHEGLTFPRPPIEKLAVDEGREYFNYLSLQHNLYAQKRLPPGSTLALALEQKITRIKDRIFRLLTLLYPWRDITAAQWTLAHADTRSRASASEYLDNILEGQLRKRIMPVIEEMPLEEKVRRGNVLLKTRPRDVEETLLQLINDEDQVVAAAAIDTAREHKIWALAGDIEHVLAHRDVRDWYVFEAASWALAEQRMPAERRRELWHEPLPAAELATRLRDLPLFASVSVDELFRIASTARQVRHDAGSLLLEEGAVPESIHILLDGRVVASSRDGAPRSIVRSARFQRGAFRDADARNDAHRRPGRHAGHAQERAANSTGRQRRPGHRPLFDALGHAARRHRHRRGSRRRPRGPGEKRPDTGRESPRTSAGAAVRPGCRRRDAAARGRCTNRRTGNWVEGVRRVGVAGVVADSFRGTGADLGGRRAAHRQGWRGDWPARSARRTAAGHGSEGPRARRRAAPRSRGPVLAARRASGTAPSDLFRHVPRRRRPALVVLVRGTSSPGTPLRRRSRGPHAPLRSNLRRGSARRLPAVGLAKAGPVHQPTAPAGKPAARFAGLARVRRPYPRLTASTMWRAEMPNLSTSSSGWPLRGISRTARRSTTTPDGISASATASPRPPAE